MHHAHSQKSFVKSHLLFRVFSSASLHENEDSRKTVNKVQPIDSSEPACRKRLEAVLFLSREPLSSRKLSQYADLADGTQARTLVKKLNKHYDSVGRAFHIKQVADGFQMLTRPPFAPWLRRLHNSNNSNRLSGPLLETLAVVAYRQPLMKAEIEAIRGVGCSEMLRQLMDRQLVRISGRSTELGRPYLYATTKLFLKSFGFASLDAMPRADHLRGKGLPDWATESESLESNNHDPSPTVKNPEDSSVSVSSPSTLLKPAEVSTTDPQTDADRENQQLQRDGVRASDYDDDEFDDDDDEEDEEGDDVDEEDDDDEYEDDGETEDDEEDEDDEDEDDWDDDELGDDLDDDDDDDEDSDDYEDDEWEEVDDDEWSEEDDEDEFDDDDDEEEDDEDWE